MATSSYLAESVVLLFRWRVIISKHQTVGHCNVSKTQVGKCKPILQDN